MSWFGRGSEENGSATPHNATFRNATPRNAVRGRLVFFGNATSHSLAPIPSPLTPSRP